MELGMKNNVRKLRIAAGFEPKDFAAAANISVSFLSRIERGERGLSMELAADFSRILKCDANELVPMNFGHKLPAEADMNTMTVVVGAVLEAIEEAKIKVSPDETGAIASFMYNQAINSSLTVMQIREISKTLIKARKKNLKAEPLVVYPRKKSSAK
jgi:transcriptional regulator with XRE-family HTH domain